MKLPNADFVEVPEAKVTSYLLSAEHPHGRHKAAFFRSFGFDVERWEELAAALARHAARFEVASTETSQFGTRYTVEGPLSTPSGRMPPVRTVWFVDTGDAVPRFVTAYPLRGSRP